MQSILQERARLRGAVQYLLAEFPRKRPLTKLSLGLFALRQIECTLARPFRIAVIGNALSGKSELIRNLLGASSLPPIRQRFAHAPVYFTHGAKTDLHFLDMRGATLRPEQAEEAAQSRSMRPGVIYTAGQTRSSGLFFPQAGLDNSESKISHVEASLPIAMLQLVEFIEHRSELMTQEQSPRLAQILKSVDMTIWCTVATQAWRESERRAFVRAPAKFRRRAVLIVTFGDGLNSDVEEKRLIERLCNEVSPLFTHLLFTHSREFLDRSFQTGWDTIQKLITRRIAEQHNRVRSLIERFSPLPAASNAALR